MLNKTLTKEKLNQLKISCTKTTCITYNKDNRGILNPNHCSSYNNYYLTHTNSCKQYIPFELKTWRQEFPILSKGQTLKVLKSDYPELVEYIDLVINNI